MTNCAPSLREMRAGQADRVRCFLAVARDFFRTKLDPADAAWRIPLTMESGRLDMQMSVAFYEGDREDVALANKLTRRAPIKMAADGHRFHIFQTSIACHLRYRYAEQMEPETRAWCEQVIREGNVENPGNWACDYQFHGYNDNMPAMACKSLILGGELLDRPDWVEMGLWRLRRLAGILSRRGLIAEYNSVNYTMDTLNALCTIEQYARHEEIRQLCRKIVHRIWADLAVHWHPQGKTAAGPYSRAYNAGFNNQLHTLKCVVWYLFGETVSGLTPMEACSPRPGLQLLHGDDTLEHTARMVWYTSSEYPFLTDELASLFLRKPDPYEVIATSEHGDSQTTPARVATTTTFIRDAYSLGSTSYGFCGGEQTAALLVTTRAACDMPPTLSVRYLLDGDEPGRIAENDFHHVTRGESEHSSHATAVTLQHRATAMASYVPHRGLAEQAVGHLRLAVIVPTAFHAIDELRIGERSVADWSGTFDARQWVGVRVGDALIAFRPLAYNGGDSDGASLSAVARESGHHRWIEIVNYHGAPKTFDARELAEMLNGMVIEVARAEDYDSLADFCGVLRRAARFEDQFIFGTRRMRYQRAALADREKLTLELNYSTWADGVSIRVINGRPAPESIWQATSVPAESLPFLGADGAYVPPVGLPWSQLRAGFDETMRLAIHEGGAAL